MRIGAALLLVLSFLTLSGGGALMLAEQHREYRAAVASYDGALAELEEAVAAAKLAAVEEGAAREELSASIAESDRVLAALGRTRESTPAVAEAVERSSALLGSAQASPPDPPGTPERRYGAEQHLRGADEARTAAQQGEAFIAGSGARAEKLRGAKEALALAWSDTAKQAAAEIDAVLASNPDSTDSSKSALGAMAAKLRSPRFALSEETLGMWVALPATLAQAAEEHAAVQAQRAAAATAAAASAVGSGRGAGGSGGSSAGSGGSGGGGSSGAGGVAASEAGGVLAETNAHRAANGLGPLSNNGSLVSYACSWASTLATRDSGLSHGGFPGGFRVWGENVAAGYGSASAVVTGWMNSSGHRANILGGSYTQMGACMARGASGTLYWVQQFGG